jgi:hypothetical protein
LGIKQGNFRLKVRTSFYILADLVFALGPQPR